MRTLLLLTVLIVSVMTRSLLAEEVGCANAARAAISVAERSACSDAWTGYEHALKCEDLSEADAGRVRARQSLCLSEQGRYGDAGDYADWALHLIPEDRSILQLHARAMLAEGQFEAAAASLAKLRRQSPQAANVSPPFLIAVRGEVFQLEPDFATDDLPQARSIAELLAALPQDLAQSASVSEYHILEEVEERCWAAQFQLENAVADAAGTSPEAEDKLAFVMAEGEAPQPLQALHDRHQALYLLARGMRKFLDFPVRPPGLGHFTVTVNLTAEIGEAYHKVRAAYRAGDIRLLDRVAIYPIRVVVPTGAVMEIHNGHELSSRRALLFSSALRSRILAGGLDGYSMAGGAVSLGGKNGIGLVRIDMRQQ